MAKKRIYFDYAATTPVDPRVVKEMIPFFSRQFGNPASLHSFGQEAKIAVEKSRENVAKLMNANPEEIVFTGSATESNNLVLKGIAFANKDKGKHIIISSIEHDCIINSAKWLEGQGFEVDIISVSKEGLINSNQVKKSLRKDTILVSIMHANNEIGTIQPISEIGAICRKNGIYFHTDAAQSFGKIPIDVRKMNIDLLTASSHKMYGPKGVSCLFIRKGVKIRPIMHGGGQESGLRSSTLNVPAIVGFGKICLLREKEMKREQEKLEKMRDKIIKEILKIKGSFLNGHPQKRLPNNINIRFDGIEGEALIMRLDLLGIAVSTGSACSVGSLKPSHVLLAIGLNKNQVNGSLRITLGKWTKEEEINYLLKILPAIVEDLRKIA